METVSTTSTAVEENITDDSTQNIEFRYELIAQSSDIKVERRDNFPQGCSFSPDGLCILTATVGDSKLRLYNTPLSLLASRKCNKDTNDEHVVSDVGNSDKNTSDNPPSGDQQVEPVDVIQIEKWITALSSVGGDSIRSYAW
jgi:hypothetical protein